MLFPQRFARRFECRTRANVGDAAAPLVINQSCCDIHATQRYHTILRDEVRGGKSESMTALIAAHDAAFNAIRSAQHAARHVHLALGQHFTNAAGADPPPTQTHFWNLVRMKTKLIAYPFQEIDIALA